MMKKLFAVVSVLCFYVLIVLVFSAADSRGYVGQFLSKPGWTDNTALAVATDYSGVSSPAMASLRRPMPKPERPPYPPPDVTWRRPMPKPERPPYPPPDVTWRRPMPKPERPPYPPPDVQ